jgi:hypothetical protein
MAETYDVIAAFADGERVNPEALKDALADDAGREYLVELLVLRDLVLASDPEMELSARSSARRDRRTWLGIAAALVACVLGGYAVGWQSHDAIDGRDGTSPDSAAVSAPAPTRVIHLQPGIDWKETSGG